MSNARQTFSDRDSINLSWIAYDGRLFMDDDVLDRCFAATYKSVSNICRIFAGEKLVTHDFN